jgi:gluconokinase
MPWLVAIHNRLRDAAGRRVSLVVACSALKASYRTVIERGLRVIWVYLRGDKRLIGARLSHRTGHMVGAELLDSQLETLEEPCEAIVEGVERPPMAIVEHIIARLRTLDPGLGPGQARVD